MDAKQFLKEKGITNNDFMDSGVADLIETLLTEYKALQLQQTGVMQSVLFADWIVKKGYKLNQMNYSNNGGMWFFDKKSVGSTTAELYKQYIFETVA